MKITIEYDHNTAKHMATTSEDIIKKLATKFDAQYDVTEVLNALNEDIHLESKSGSSTHTVGTDGKNVLVMNIKTEFVEDYFEMVLKIGEKILPFVSAIKAGIQMFKNFVKDCKDLGNKLCDKWYEKPEEGKFAIINFDLCGHDAKALLRLSAYGMRSVMIAEARGNVKLANAAYEIAKEKMNNLLPEEFSYSYDDAMQIFRGRKEKEEKSEG